jgi:hypothetical protein
MGMIEARRLRVPDAVWQHAQFVRAAAVATIAACVPVLAAACTGDICDADDLHAALSVARPGEELQLGACALEGNFTVPSGVAVSGRGVGRTRIVGAEGAPAITLSGGDEPSSVSQLTITAPAPGAIAVDGGIAELADITIESTSDAYGVLAADADALSVSRVDLRGPLTSDDWFDAATSSWPRLGEGRGVGLVVARSSEVHLTEIEARGLVLGALFVNSDTTWSDGLVEESFRGLVVTGGRLQLSGIRVADFVQRGESDLTGAAMVALRGADASLTDLQVVGDAQYAALALFDSSAQIRALTVSGSERAGLHLSDVDGLVLESSLIESVRTIGIRIQRSNDVVIRDTHVVDIELGALPSEPRPLVLDVGDGVLIAQSTGVSLHRVEVENSARVGISVEACEDSSSLPTFESVTVTAFGEQRGAYASIQTGDGGWLPAPMGWDEGILRAGTAVLNDAANTPLLPTDTGDCP